jgi:hypothetical protein
MMEAWCIRNLLEWTRRPEPQKTHDVLSSKAISWQNSFIPYFSVVVVMEGQSLFY